jgi:hypothetical protein
MARTEAYSMGMRCPDAWRARRGDVPLVDIVDYDLWLRRRVSGHVFSQEAGNATGHMDARSPDSKLFAMRAVDMVEIVLTALSWRFLWTSCRKGRLLQTSPPTLGCYR